MSDISCESSAGAEKYKNIFRLSSDAVTGALRVNCCYCIFLSFCRL